MKRFTVQLLFVFSAAIFVLFLFSPDTVQRTAYESVLFCSAVLIPSLFPGFVLSDVLISLSSGAKHRSGGLFFQVFRLPPALIRCWLIGLLAGFPTAADCAVRMVRAGEIEKNDGERCLAFTNNPGIVFVICAVGSGIFGSMFIGLYLWIIQTVAAILVGVVMANPNRKITFESMCSKVQISLGNVFPKAVVSSVSAALNICGFVIFFRVLIAVFSSSFLPDSLRILFSGLLEMTCGLSNFSQFTMVSAIFASFLLGWSGISVHFQILNVISAAELSPRYYFPGKVIQAFLSSVIAAVTYPLIFDLPGFVFEQILWICLIVSLFVIFAIRFRKEYLCGKRNI